MSLHYLKNSTVLSPWHAVKQCSFFLQLRGSRQLFFLEHSARHPQLVVGCKLKTKIDRASGFTTFHREDQLPWGDAGIEPILHAIALLLMRRDDQRTFFAEGKILTPIRVFTPPGAPKFFLRTEQFLERLQWCEWSLLRET